MSYYPNKLSFFLRLFQLLFNPLQHFTRISWVSQQKPILIILSLSIQGQNLDIIEFWERNTVISFGSEHIIGFIVKPRFPCFCQTSNQHFLSFSFIVVDVYRVTLMIAHCWNNSCLSCFLNQLTLDKREIKIVALSLLPNIMSSIISSPENKVNTTFFQFFSE